jgi:hypothetical protein
MADIGRGAPHVTADQSIKPSRFSHFDHANNSASVAQQDRIFA